MVLQLCPKCASLSWHRRTRMVDLSGKIALVTGARVKIGKSHITKL